MPDDHALNELRSRLFAASNKLSVKMRPYRILDNPQKGWVVATDYGTRSGLNAWLTIYLLEQPTPEQQALIPEEIDGIKIKIVVSGKYQPNVLGPGFLK